MEHESEQVASVKCILFDKLFQCHEQQQWKTVRTKTTSPRSTFTNKLPQLYITAEEEVTQGDKNNPQQVCEISGPCI